MALIQKAFFYKGFRGSGACARGASLLALWPRCRRSHCCKTLTDNKTGPQLICFQIGTSYEQRGCYRHSHRSGWRGAAGSSGVCVLSALTDTVNSSHSANTSLRSHQRERALQLLPVPHESPALQCSPFWWHGVLAHSDLNGHFSDDWWGWTSLLYTCCLHWVHGHTYVCVYAVH